MKIRLTILFVLALGVSTLEAQTDPAAKPPVAGPMAALKGLAIRFTGTIGGATVDVTVTADGANSTDDSLSILVLSLAKEGNSYLVNYTAYHYVPMVVQIGSQPSTTPPIVSLVPSGPKGWINLKPGQPVNVMKSASTDLTLTLTELPPPQ